MPIDRMTAEKAQGLKISPKTASVLAMMCNAQSLKAETLQFLGEALTDDNAQKYYDNNFANAFTTMQKALSSLLSVHILEDLMQTTTKGN